MKIHAFACLVILVTQNDVGMGADAMQSGLSSEGLMQVARADCLQPVPDL